MRNIASLAQVFSLVSFLLLAHLSTAQSPGEKQASFMKRYQLMLGDWLSIYGATYAGEYNAQIENVLDQAAAKADEAIEESGLEGDSGEIKSLIELMTSNPFNEELLASFQQNTGIKVYLTGLIDGHRDQRFQTIFNKISHAKHQEKRAPYLDVVVMQTRDTVNGTFQLSVSCSSSDEFRKLKDHPADYWNEHFHDSYASRSEARKHLRGVMQVALAEIQAKVGNVYLPDLVLWHKGKTYRDGDQLEVGAQPDGFTELKALDKEGKGIKVDWKVLPNGKLHTSTDSTLIFQSDEAGLWTVEAATSQHQLAVHLNIIKVPVDWKSILRVVLQEVLNDLLKKADEAIWKEPVDTQANQQALAAWQSEDEKITGYVSGHALLAFSVEETDESFALEKAIPKDEGYRKALANYQTYLSAASSAHLKEARKLALLLLLEKNNLSMLEDKLTRDLPTLAAGITAKLVKGEGREELHAFLASYTNDILDHLILQSLGPEIGTLYLLVQTGADREQIRGWMTEMLLMQYDKMVEGK